MNGPLLFPCRFNHLYPPEFTPPISWVIIHSFIQLLLDKVHGGHVLLQTLGTNRMEWTFSPRRRHQLSPCGPQPLCPWGSGTNGTCLVWFSEDEIKQRVHAMQHRAQYHQSHAMLQWSLIITLMTTHWVQCGLLKSKFILWMLLLTFKDNYK